MEHPEATEIDSFSQETVETVTMEGGTFGDAQHQLRLEGDNNIVIVMQGNSGTADMQTVSRATISHTQPQGQILEDGSVGVTMASADDSYGAAEGGVRVVTVDMDGNSVTWSSQDQGHTEEVRDSDSWGSAQNAGGAEVLSMDGSLAACLVCGDRASGYHYSVFSCEGCKGFFKRTVQKNLQYSCKDSGTCAINKFTRNSCQHCRFNKCLGMGMKKEAVREDRSPGGKHRHKRQRTDDLITMTTGDLLGGLSENQAFQDPLVDRLVAAQPDRVPKADGSCGSLISINGLMQYGYMELKFIIQWAKKVPGFQELEVPDQMALLKSSFMELNVFRLAFRSMGLDNMIKFADQVVIPVDEVQTMGWGKELVSATLDLAHKLVELNLDLTEFCILNAIVLTYPDASGIQDKIRVLNLQSRILDCLRRYMQHRNPSDLKRFSKMLLRLPALRTVSAKAAERFLSLTLDGSIQLNELVLEMIN
ncbi:retinoic acid receptor RXR-alpha-B-like [Babylonia areolata]|uniref:retinoic acid receptor RXR-alpha-B-like n=1 Tax=Babylonia areolata TaxID=304850 RepID=UPI003FD3EEB5